MNSLEMEYNALRTEILKRVELRQRITLATIAIAGGFIGFGIQSDVKLYLVLFYPIFAFCLALSWVQINRRLGLLGLYIRKK